MSSKQVIDFMDVIPRISRRKCFCLVVGTVFSVTEARLMTPSSVDLHARMLRETVESMVAQCSIAAASSCSREQQACLGNLPHRNMVRVLCVHEAAMCVCR